MIPNTNPNAASNAAPTSAEAAPQTPTHDARYGAASYNSGARYMTDDPPVDVAPDDGGIVKLGTTTMPDTVFLNFAGTENEAVTDNPNYTEPMPSVIDLGTGITLFQMRLNAMEALKLQLKEATNQKNVARASLENMVKVRANYVQLTSNGNTALILNAGFQVRATPTPVGILYPPTNLSLELNGTPGIAFLRWTGSLNSRGYNIQISPANTMEREWAAFDTTTVTRLKCEGLTLGQLYAFRIAAIGGSTGQSDWSAEVIRMAA